MGTLLKPKVAVIDDDQVFTCILHQGLRKNGYYVYDINTSEDALEFISEAKDVDIFIVDFDLGEDSEDGLSLCRKIRTYTSKPIIMLTGETSTDLTVSCLYAGADHYVTKPYNLQDLIARMHVVLNRPSDGGAKAPDPLTLTYRAVTLDGKRRELRGEKNSVTLTQREIQLAEVLFMNPDEVKHRDKIYTQIFGKQMPPFHRGIDIIVGRLRKKLAAASDDITIEPSRSAGYRLIFLGEDTTATSCG